MSVTPVTGGLRADVCVNGTTGYAMTVPDAPTAQPALTQGACLPE